MICQSMGESAMNSDANPTSSGEQFANQQQSLGDVQVQGDGNVLNVIQGRDVQVVNLTVYDRIPAIVSQLGARVLPSAIQQDARFRKVLLNKVKKYWIQDVLEKSLHTQVLVELGLEERLDAVEDSFNCLQAITEEVKRVSLDNKNVIQVFHQMGEGRTLLILGEPGSGKTITLLRLAKDLIARTEQDMSQPIPVVLNLSSWGVKQMAIANWLVEELNSKYQVSKDLGQAWINQQQLLLLLDGLDEVKANCREACVQALNQFVQNYGQTEIVICSRLQDYEALSTRLQLQAALYLQSLRTDQVGQYLEQAGEQLQVLKILLRQNETLQELARSPLMLSVMSLAYQRKTPDEIPQAGSMQEICQQLFDAYIQQMLRRRQRGGRYSETQTLHWLTQLAQQMVEDGQTLFLIERMQPNWLKPGKQILLYRIGLVVVSGLIGGSICGLTGGLSGGLNCDSQASLSIRWIDGLQWGLVLGLLGGGVSALSVVTGKEDIKPVETFQLSWATFTQSLNRRTTLQKGLLGAAIGAVGGGLCAGLTHSLLLEGTLLGLVWGLGFGLVMGVSSGLAGSEIEAKTVPNQGIWRSALNAAWIGLSFGLIIALLSVLGFTLMGLNGTCQLIAVPLIVIQFGGLGTVVNLAGRACLRHLTLRLVLWNQGILPWNYARFLDSAVGDVFLQRAGGTYFFMHRMLLEHFAQMKS